LEAKELYNTEVLGGLEENEFDPEFGYKQLCALLTL
jgi:hypothetical protein